MGRHIRASTIFVATALLLITLIPSAVLASTESALNAEYGLLNQKLYVTIQPSLYSYYSNLSHSLANDYAYAKLITPHTVQPIADNLRNLTQNLPYSDEQFADAVLSFIHQIPYNITGAKYPVETLVDNRGDCGALSILAASIMKAGGLDVVLIKYTGIDPGHMNVGVYLPYTPAYHSILLSPISFTYNNKTYWTAEATPQADWKVGDQSMSIADATPIIIPLNKTEESSPGQISSTLGAAPQPSKITINVSQQPADQAGGKRALLISGAIQPVQPNSTIRLFINDNPVYQKYNTTLTDDNGAFSFVWNLTEDGTYYITAAWNGNNTFSGIDSETLVVFIGPQALIQFQTETYNYVIGIPIADVAIRRFVGVDNYLDVPLGTNVSVSYNLAILPTGSAESEIPTANVTVPLRQHVMHPSQPTDGPQKTVMVPTGIPLGMQKLMLPDDFNQTINNKFCLIFQREQNGSYSLSIRGLNDYEVSDYQQDTLFNATQDIQESIWYRVTTNLSGNGVDANILREDGVPIQNIPATSSNSSKPLVVLLTNNVDTAVVLRDFKVHATNTPTQPTKGTTAPDKVTDSFPYFYVLAAAVAIIVLAFVLVKIRKNATKRSALRIRTNIS